MESMDASTVARACAPPNDADASTSEADYRTMIEILERQRILSTIDRRARAALALRVLECARSVAANVTHRVKALERATARTTTRANAGTAAATTLDGARGDDSAESADAMRHGGKTTSRLSIADESEFPSLASGARRNLAIALDGTASGDGKPRRVAPTPVETNGTNGARPPVGNGFHAQVTHCASPMGGARRIAPTMVSRPVDGDLSSSFTASGAATPASKPSSSSASPSSTMKRAAATATALTLERLYVNEPRPMEPIELPTPLAMLATLHAAALRAGFPLDQSPELAWLCALLGAPSDLIVETIEGSAKLVMRTGREAHAYASKVLSLVPALACALGEGALEALAESNVLASHASALHREIVRELGAVRVASGECERAYQVDGRVGSKLYGFDLLDALAKADERRGRANARPGRAIPLTENQAIEHNRERTRDAFYALLRASASRSVGLGQDASIASRARTLIANTHPANMRWLADLFVARLSQSSAVGEVDEELGNSITPARLSRLHERIVGSNAATQAPQGGRSGAGARVDGRGGRGGRGRTLGRGGGEKSTNGVTQTNGFGAEVTHTWPSFVCLFPPAQQPFVRFIETTDSHKFCVALQRSLVAALHVLDPNAHPSEDAAQSPASSSNAGQTERMLAAHAMGSFLGLLTFGFASGATSARVASNSMAPQGIDLTSTLQRAGRRGELVVSAPWVLAFLRFLMWDADSLDIAHYAEALAYLRAIAASPSLDPFAVKGEFNSSRMCLRSILANGLSVNAPITTVQASTWTSNNVMGLPPPPLAVMDALPTTSKEIMQSYEDPLAIDNWGREWVPSASANASATANSQEVPDSPSESDSRIETQTAPDLSRVGVDRRYVETVCPSVDRAVRTLKQRGAIAQALVEEKEQLTKEAPRSLMQTPSQPTNVPRRMQAQPQRVEPTSVSKSTQAQDFGGVFEAKNTLSPTFGVTSPNAESALATMPSMDLKSSSTEIKHALQRAFLQNVPGLRRLVDFAVDAATLAAVDDATAAITASAVESAQEVVSAAATQAAMKYAESAKRNGTSFVSHASSVIEEAWTPEFERAVERSAMSVTRDVISSVASTAADDAGARAAAAVAALSGANTSRGGAAATGGSSAATRAACGVAADAAAFAAADRVRRNLPFELHARVASDARRLLKSALGAAKEAMSAPATEETDTQKSSSREAEYASVAASAIAAALSSASKWPAGTLLAECSSLKLLADRKADALALSRGIKSVIECTRKVLEQDAKFIRVQTSRKKPSTHVEKPIPDSRPGEQLASMLVQLARAYVKLLLAAPQNALSKTTKAKEAEEGWGISRDEVCEGLTATLIATFTASAPALNLVSALAPPDSPDPWKRVYDEMFAGELWLAALREFPESPFAQKRIELIFAEAISKLPRRSVLRTAFLHLIDDADKRVGRLGHALAIRGAIRFCAVVAASATHDDAEEVTAIAAFAEDLRQRCEAAGENRLARRAEGAHRSLTSGSVYANIKSVATPTKS